MEFIEDTPEGVAHCLKFNGDETQVVLAAFREEAARRLAQQLPVGTFAMSMIDICKSNFRGAEVSLPEARGIFDLAYVLDRFTTATPEVVQQLATKPTAFLSDDAMKRQSMGETAGVIRDQINDRVKGQQDIDQDVANGIDEIERFLSGDA